MKGRGLKKLAKIAVGLGLLVSPATAVAAGGNGWWFYSYPLRACAPATITPGAYYDSLTSEAAAPTIIRVNPEHVRIQFPDPSNAKIVDFNDFFRNEAACETFREQIVPNADLY